MRCEVGYSSQKDTSMEVANIFPEPPAAGQTQWTKPLASQATQSSSSQLSAASGVSFVASASFAGLRPGYVFKSGPEGVGYYADHGSTSMQGMT